MRGWGPEAFRLVRPEFLSLVRYGVMVERLLPLYENAREAQGEDLAGLSAEQKVGVARRKLAARDVLAELTPVLFPDG